MIPTKTTKIGIHRMKMESQYICICLAKYGIMSSSQENCYCKNIAIYKTTDIIVTNDACNLSALETGPLQKFPVHIRMQTVVRLPVSC